MLIAAIFNSLSVVISLRPQPDGDEMMKRRGGVKTDKTLMRDFQFVSMEIEFIHLL